MNQFFQFLKGFKKGMHDFGQNVSLIINSILLLIVYIAGVGITFIFSKILHKHFLDLKISKNHKTYWSDLNLNKKKIEEYYRQF